MNIRFHLPILLLALLAFGLPHQARAADSYDGCTGFITSLPAIISTQGIWCFNQSLTTSATSGNAITINTNNVTIDCNHFRLDGSAAGTGTAAIGIYAGSRVKVTVRRCAISGYYVGAKLTGSGHVVDGNVFNGNTSIGLVIDASSAKNASMVQDNQVLNTGGSTLIGTVYGIWAHQSVDVLGNTVSGVTARSTSNGNAFGIYTTGTSYGASVRDNHVHNLNKDGTGLVYGIYNDTSSHVILRNNDVSATGSVGLYCSSGNSAARDNVTHDFTTSISNCNDVTGNFHTP